MNKMSAISKTLVILPGAGDRSSPGYASVYELLVEEAKKRGYSKTVVMSYPGQASCMTEGELSLTGAVRYVIGACSEMQGPLILLGRSFGCFVALEMARSMGENIQEIKLWGPPPFWHTWEVLAKDVDARNAAGQEKGVCFAENVFSTMNPIESLLKNVTVKTRVVVGTQDKVATPDFVTYLQAIVQNNAFVTFSPLVQGAGHEVTSSNDPGIVERYIDALFDT